MTRKDANEDLQLIYERKVLPNHNEYCRHSRGYHMQEYVLSAHPYQPVFVHNSDFDVL